MIEIDNKLLVEAINRIAATDDGKIVLACLKEFCMYDKDLTVDGSLEDTYANSVLRRPYLYLRNNIESIYLKDIEFNYKRKVITNGKRYTIRSDRPDTSKPK